MTGAEHYREAERIIEVARERDKQIPEMNERELALYRITRADSIAVSQVHATLALAAATAHDTETGFARIGEYGGRPSERA